MIPLHRPWFDEREEAALLRTLRGGQLAGNGTECAALERELGDRLGAPFVLAVSSASHALEMAIELAGARGGEVIIPSFTFPSVGNAIVRSGATPVFCEVREPDLNVDLAHARSLISPRTRAVVVTHYAGHPVDFRGVAVPVVEDAAHALGSRAARGPCGLLGDFGCFSFHHSKNLVAGEGGALICSTPEAAARGRVMRQKGTNRDDFVEGRTPFYTWVGWGSSYVLPELSAALARVQVSKWDAILARRARIAARYLDGLGGLEAAGRLRIVRPTGEGSTCWHIFAILVDPLRRGDLIRGMRRSGVEAASHFVPLHSSPFGRSLGSTAQLPVTDRLAASVVRLPIYPGLSDEEQDRVVDAVMEALG